jgi:hypothetical protein
MCLQVGRCRGGGARTRCRAFRGARRCSQQAQAQHPAQRRQYRQTALHQLSPPLGTALRAQPASRRRCALRVLPAGNASTPLAPLHGCPGGRTPEKSRRRSRGRPPFCGGVAPRRPDSVTSSQSAARSAFPFPNRSFLSGECSHRQNVEPRCSCDNFENVELNVELTVRQQAWSHFIPSCDGLSRCGLQGRRYRFSSSTWRSDPRRPCGGGNHVSVVSRGGSATGERAAGQPQRPFDDAAVEEHEPGGGEAVV